MPAPGPDRDSLLLRLMGSPDPMQLDGLGGSHSSTSKVVAVSASDRADCDVEYPWSPSTWIRPGPCSELRFPRAIPATQ